MFCRGMLPGYLVCAGALFADGISLVRVTDSWRYLKGTSEASSPVDAWRQPGYDDSSWTVGDAGIGYGGLAPATELTDMQGNYVSVFMRTTFTIDNLSDIQWLILRADYDDGFVAYINGVEVWRQGFALGPPVPYNATAPSHSGGIAEEFNISYAIAHLVTGTNTFAIQAHNSDVNSPDLRIVPELLANFNRGPYIQDVQADQLRIIWRTPLPADTAVHYGASTNLGSTAADSSPTTQHVLKLSSLTPDTTYYYRISSSTDGVNDVLSPLMTFKTAGTSGDVSFVVMGDSGFGSSAQYDVAEVIRNQDVDFVLHVGDVIYPEFTYGETDLKCLSVYGEHMRQVPYYFAMGNHDIQQTSSGGACIHDENPFLDAFYLPTNSVTGTEHYYSFDSGNAHIVVLSSDKRLHSYTAGSAQYNWLAADLAGSSKPWKFILFHHCPYTSSAHRYDDNDYFANPSCTWAGNGIVDRSEIKDSVGVLASQHGAQLMFFGHEHNYEKFNPVGGVHSVLSGAGGADLRGLNASASDIDTASSQFWEKHSIAKVTLNGDGLTLDALDNAGQAFDHLYIQRAAPPSQVWSSSWHSPVIEVGPGGDDGNHAGQTLDFIGTPIPTVSGAFSNPGRVFVNNDATNLYIAFEQTLFYDDNNLFLFIDVSTLSGVTNMNGIGNGFVDPLGQAADGLDMLKNVSFQGFSPDIGCILGDEYGDGQFRKFARPNPGLLDIGQGIFRLDAGITDISNTRLQQYNRSPQATGVGYEQDANLIELCIPFSSLGGLQPTGQVIKIGAICGGGGHTEATQTRYLDTSFLGQSLTGSGENPVTLESVSVLLQSAGDDQDLDGLSNEAERLLGTRPDLADTDGDSLTDGFEIAGGLNPLSPVGVDGPLGDPDLDGMNNAKEQYTGTNPNDAASVFAGSVNWSPGLGTTVSWPSIVTRTYTLYRAGAVTGSYSSVDSGLAATPPVNTYPDATATGSGPYYYYIMVE